MTESFFDRIIWRKKPNEPPIKTMNTDIQIGLDAPRKIPHNNLRNVEDYRDAKRNMQRSQEKLLNNLFPATHAPGEAPDNKSDSAGPWSAGKPVDPRSADPSPYQRKQL